MKKTQQERLEKRILNIINNDLNFLEKRFVEKDYTAFGYEVIYNEGLLWYRVYASGKSFIIAINPHDGYYEWIHYIKESNKIDSVKFHKGRMYLRDINGTLFVYEKNI